MRHEIVKWFAERAGDDCMMAERQLEFMDGDKPHPLEALAQRLKQWAGRNVFFGTSSWKYEGWLGTVYSRDRYFARGKFSPRQFEEHCLEEYAEIFPSVFGDFTFYQFYPEAYWQKLFAQVPPAFQFGFKVPEMITAPVFPEHARYGTRRGQANENFLNADLLRQGFLDRLEPRRAQVGCIVFQFPQFSRSTLAALGGFTDRLDGFLQRLPGSFRYAVEIRTESLLGAGYFDCLRRNRVAHVFNSWTRMPTIGGQLALSGSITTDVVVCRALLRPGRAYEEAVRLFQPYDKVRDPYPEGYRDVAALVRKAGEQGPKPKVFIAVNNRFVGNAITAITEILDELEKERDATRA